jgi:hypothetical protein
MVLLYLPQKLRGLSQWLSTKKMIPAVVGLRSEDAVLEAPGMSNERQDAASLTPIRRLPGGLPGGCRIGTLCAFLTGREKCGYRLTKRSHRER